MIHLGVAHGLNYFWYNPFLGDELKNRFPTFNKAGASRRTTVPSVATQQVWKFPLGCGSPRAEVPGKGSAWDSVLDRQSVEVVQNVGVVPHVFYIFFPLLD